jgi:hypothetical protein
MGCWNKTCALSNLHIYAGEPVYVFILENTPETSHCYSTHFYSPILIPFYSQYDDYGTGENSSGVGLQIIIDSIKEKLVEKEVGENEYHDIAVKKDNFGEDLLFDSMRENRLEVKNNSLFNNTTSLQFVMMRADIVDGILSKYKPEIFRRNASGHYNSNEDSLNDLIGEVDSAIEIIQKELKSIEGLELDYMLLSYSYASTYEHIFRKNENKLAEWIRWFDNTSFGRTVNPMKALLAFIHNNQIEEAREFFIDMLKGCFIASFIERTRRSWIPQSGEGSQDTELKNHKLLAQTILNAIEVEEKMMVES